jgi:uncharacterized protein
MNCIFKPILIILPNVEKVDVFFQLNIINIDPGDNKFIDCAFVGNAHYIVTEDNHFNILLLIDFPKTPVISAEEPKQILV